MQPLEAFLDESGTHKGAAVLSVGACVGSAKQWRHFLKLWTEPHFHSKEQSSASLKPALLEAIKESRIRCIVSFIDPAEYANNAGIRLKAGLGNAYIAAVISCVVVICRTAKKPVSFVIEDGQPNSRWARRILEGMARLPEWRGCISAVALVPKKKSSQLHAADFVAHSWSTTNVWYSRLKEKARAQEIPLTAELIQIASADHEQRMKRVRAASKAHKLLL